MKLYNFQISLPQCHTRTFYFSEFDKAVSYLDHYLNSDSRFRPTPLGEQDLGSTPVVVDKNNPYKEYHIDNLSYIGERHAYIAGSTAHQIWYAEPSYETSVRQQYESAMKEPNTEIQKTRSQHQSLFSSFMDFK